MYSRTVILWVWNKYIISKPDVNDLCGKEKTTDNCGSSVYKTL